MISIRVGVRITKMLYCKIVGKHNNSFNICVGFFYISFFYACVLLPRLRKCPLSHVL